MIQSIGLICKTSVNIAGMITETDALYQRDDPSSVWYFHPGIYFAFGDGLIKIGRTDYPNQRVSALRTPNGNKINQFVFIPVEVSGLRPREWEIELHNQFKEQRFVGEWFLPCGSLSVLIKELSKSADHCMTQVRKRFKDRLSVFNQSF